jgi:hypothetical protein
MSRGMSKATCALFYEAESLSGSVKVGLFETESEAADFAVVLNREGSGTPVGIQHLDGSTTLLEDWQEYSDAVQRAEEAAEEQEHPPPPTKTVVNPFDGGPVTVDRKTPRWVGRQTPTADEPMFPITPL